MQNRFQLNTGSSKPISMGTGLVTLDAVIEEQNDDYPQLWVGGSCGNVMTILAYLGWTSYPIANIGNDSASKIILDDMATWGVKTDFVYRNENIFTPIVIERLYNNRSKPTHVFKFKCPYCGSHLPRSRPVPRSLVIEILKRLPIAQVFYFDRVSRVAVEFAEILKSRGALIVFEPHRISKERLFKKCLEIAHIVKYSAEQLRSITFRRMIPLEIQTLGARGLRYKFKDSEGREHGWRKVKAFEVPELIDSAGAGDWLAAGVIHKLGQDGCNEFSQATQEDVEDSLIFGQGLATINCISQGARGIMYDIDRQDLESVLWNLITRERLEEHTRKIMPKHERRFVSQLCPSCMRKSMDIH